MTEQEFFDEVDQKIHVAKELAAEMKRSNEMRRQELIDPCYAAIKSARSALEEASVQGFDLRSIIRREDEIREVSAGILHGLFN